MDKPIIIVLLSIWNGRDIWKNCKKHRKISNLLVNQYNDKILLVISSSYILKIQTIFCTI